MKRTVEKMTLGQFIDKMKRGWGFWNPFYVTWNGETLERFFINSSDLDKVVEVEFISDSVGYAPNFHYRYTWNVKGTNLPEKEIKLPRGSAKQGENGFTVQFLW